MKKITRATVKSFIRRYRDQLFIRIDSASNGYDGYQRLENTAFEKAEVTDLSDTGTLGVKGAWFIGRGFVGGDSFESYCRDGFEGIQVGSGCSYRFVLAVRSGVLLAEQLGATLPQASAAPSRRRM